MDTRMPLLGHALRCALVLQLWVIGPMTVAQLVRVMEAAGYVVVGRPSKAVSDALRWEVRRGRVVRLQRGVYGPGNVTRQARWRLRRYLRLERASWERRLAAAEPELSLGRATCANEVQPLEALVGELARQHLRTTRPS